MNSWQTNGGPEENGLVHDKKLDPQILPYQQLQQLQLPVQGSPSTHILPPGLASTPRVNTPLRTDQTNAVEAPPTVDEDSIPDIDKFGLNGLLSTIKMENVDQTKFTIGTDLNMFGLNFLDTGLLSTSFETPWPEIVRSEVEPDFSNLAKMFEPFKDEKLTEDKFNSLTDETLFFIFYTRPNHYLQEYASKQLNSRNWRFHRDLQLWLTKDSNVEPIQQNNQSERGIYIFFDPNSWEKVKKEFVLQYLSLHQATI